MRGSEPIPNPNTKTSSNPNPNPNWHNRQTGYIVDHLCPGSNPATGLVSQSRSNPNPNPNPNPNLILNLLRAVTYVQGCELLRGPIAMRAVTGADGMGGIGSAGKGPHDAPNRNACGGRFGWHGGTGHASEGPPMMSPDRRCGSP